MMDAVRAPAFLSVRGISKTYAGIHALSGVDLDLHPGRGMALVGENGAGKSTLIKVMTGQVTPDTGTIEIAGAPVVLDSPAAALRYGVSVVPQELSLVPEMSVAENIFLGNFPRRGMFMNSREMASRAARIMARLGLDVDPGEHLGNLSPGAQQLVEIARGLSKEARLFILDEPTAALTESEAQHLFGVLAELKRNGVAVLYVSHRMNELFQVAEDVTVLRDGRVVKNWHSEAVPESEIVHAMVGRPVERFFHSLRHRVADDEEVLRVENLSRTGVIKNISFKVGRGEILALSGLMGAGRTEVLRAIFGADKPDTGRIFVYGEEVHIGSPRDAIKAGMAFVPEERKAQGVVEMMSIADNLSLPHLKRWTKGGFLRDDVMRREITDVARQMTVKFDVLNNPVRSLSGGNQQKVVLGKWMTAKPRVFLLDEPTRGIDVGAKFELYTLISQLAEQGCAILLVSSELPEVLGLADRIIVLKDGAIVGEMTAEDATEQAVVELAMLGAAAPAMAADH
jgi:ABC-type sugar transport system ATPase subunit